MDGIAIPLLIYDLFVGISISSKGMSRRFFLPRLEGTLASFHFNFFFCTPTLVFLSQLILGTKLIFLDASSVVL